MDLIKRHKRLFLVSGILICVLAIYFTSRPGFNESFLEKAIGYAIVPIQSGASSVSSFIAGKIQSFRDSERLRTENIALREKINRLETDYERLSRAEEENIKLTELLNIVLIYSELPKTGARVIGKDPNEWYDSYLIDIGTREGVEQEMAVLGDGGMLGIIREAYPTYSKFITLADPRFSVSVTSKRTEDNGVLKGDIDYLPSGLCVMEYIEADAQIMAGDEIYTSASSTFCPPGILVGTVESIGPDLSGLTMRAVVRPASKLDGIEAVLVVNQLFGDASTINEAGIGE